MFSWFFNLFSSRPSDGFLPCEQEYYPYWDGKRMRKGDPLTILRKLYSAEGMNLDSELNVAALPSGEALEAHGNIFRAIRGAFDVKTIEEGGLLDTKCKELMIHFMAWCEKKNQSMPPSPTCYPSTLDASADQQPEASFSDFGKTEPEPSIDNQSVSSSL